MNRILGVDYGTKRVGIALSDESRKFALPCCVLPNNPKLLVEIKAIMHEHDINEVVIGDSRDYKGKANRIQDSILNLKRQLEDNGYKVNLELEFMTSMQAERFQGKTDKTDASAAAIILQSYLDKNRNQAE